MLLMEQAITFSLKQRSCPELLPLPLAAPTPCQELSDGFHPKGKAVEPASGSRLCVAVASSASGAGLSTTALRRVKSTSQHLQQGKLYPRRKMKLIISPPPILQLRTLSPRDIK